MNLTHVQELERLHFEAETGVNHEKDEIGAFRRIYHRVEVISTLVKRNAPLFSRHYSHWTADVVQFLTRVVADEILHECRFADFRWSYKSYEYRRWFQCGSVDFREL